MRCMMSILPCMFISTFIFMDLCKPKSNCSKLFWRCSSWSPHMSPLDHPIFSPLDHLMSHIDHSICPPDHPRCLLLIIPDVPCWSSQVSLVDHPRCPPLITPDVPPLIISDVPPWSFQMSPLGHSRCPPLIIPDVPLIIPDVPIVHPICPCWSSHNNYTPLDHPICFPFSIPCESSDTLCVLPFFLFSQPLDS